jgi:hypothetical protein
MTHQVFCSSVSQALQEPFIGTAPYVDLWVLIEYSGRWEADALAQSALPAPVKAWVSMLHNQFPKVRFQLIKPQSPNYSDITCFVAITQETGPRLYRFQLASYHDLLHLDLFALLADHSSSIPFLYNQPLFLVCTHGKHDCCCAIRGVPIYRELAQQVGDAAWQCSHLGGDRFAANMLCLPYGIYYARITVPEVSLVVQAQMSQQIYLCKYRGRTCYPTMVQAAECLLRQHIKEERLSALLWLNERQCAEQRWCVCFTTPSDGALHRLVISKELCAIKCFSTCKGKEVESIEQFHLHSYERLSSAQQENISPVGERSHARYGEFS